MGREGTGVEVHGKTIRLKFKYEGEWIKERLTVNGEGMLATPANLKYANRLSAEIRQKIALGVFDIAEYFPDSTRASSVAPTSFGALADMWLGTKSQLEAATKYQYQSAVNVWKTMLGEKTPMSKLTYPVLASKIGTHPWASNKLANNYLIVLRGIFTMEFHGRRAADNPMVGIKNFARVKKLPDPLTADERDMILADMQKRYDPRIYAYFLFAFYTGMRPEEMIALKWSDIDSHSGTIRVQRVRTFKGTERDGSKTHAARDVDLVSRAMEALTIMKPYTFMKKGEDGEGAYIFENPNTREQWHDERSQRNYYWTPTLKRLGIRGRRAYATRHTYATVALMRGVNPAYIARQLGHANTKMLFENYAKWIDGADKGVERRALELAMEEPAKTVEKVQTETV